MKQHHELSTRVLRRAAEIANVEEMIAFRVALGMPVEDGERAAVLKALAGLGVEVADLPCARSPQSEQAG